MSAGLVQIALGFATLGFAGVGWVNPGTAPVWFGMAALCLLLAAAVHYRERLATWRAGVRMSIAGSLRDLASRVEARPEPVHGPTGDSDRLQRTMRDLRSRNGSLIRKLGQANSQIAILQHDLELARRSQPANEATRAPQPPSTTDIRGDDARNARDEIGALIDEGRGYAERLRSLDLDADDTGYQPEDEQLVKNAEAWLADSEEVEAFWYPPGGFSIESITSFGKLLGNPQTTVPVRKPVWRQQFVLRVEARIDELQARLK